MKIKISHIKVGDRFRKDFGDLQGLADSIAELGQLHPIGVDSNYNLIFGERRIKACELLGRDTVEGSVIHLDSLIKGEFAENEFSKGWTVSERVAILEAIETIGSGGYKSKRQNFAVSKDDAAKQAGLGNTQSELHPLEEGKHAAESPLDLKAYAQRAGKGYENLRIKVKAWRVLSDSVHVYADQSRDAWRNLAEIHAAPRWGWWWLGVGGLKGRARIGRKQFTRNLRAIGNEWGFLRVLVTC